VTRGVTPPNDNLLSRENDLGQSSFGSVSYT
jgi:hypothetical protein